MSSEAVPADLLTIRAPAPDWFRWAISHPGQSLFVTVAGCRIHYLLWAREPARPGERGLLFVHGGGAHSHWWSYIAPYFIRGFRVAAIDLSGMGDSAWRAHYNSELRVEEIRAVIAAARLGERPSLTPEDRAAASLFYMGYSASRFRLKTVNANNIPDIQTRAINNCSAQPERTVAWAFARAYSQSRGW